MTSQSELGNLYRRCIGCYIQAAEACGDDTTGKVESIVLDGLHLILWGRLVGLDNGRLDPPLVRYQPYLNHELRQLVESFKSQGMLPLVAGTANTLAKRSKRNLLCRWLIDLLPETSDIEAAFTFSTSIADTQPNLDTLLATSSDVRRSMSPFLSEAQKIALARDIRCWKDKVLANTNRHALEALVRAAERTDNSLCPSKAEVVLRRHAYDEDIDFQTRLLRKLELRTEELQFLIPSSNVPQETIQDLSASHAIGRYGGEIVFIEKRRNIGWKAEGIAAIEIFLRIDSLAGRLAKPSKPPSFCVMDLLGYFSDRQHKEYGFVYSWPWDIGPSWSESYAPKTLNELLKDAESEQANPGPTLTRRFELARRIAICVKTFHLFGWLHKSLNSHNVLFFPSADESDISIDQPLVTGFEYSRQDGHNNTTEPVTEFGNYDLYRHPDVTAFERRSHPEAEQTRFERRHDLYALGLLLVEAGLWSRLEAVWELYSKEGATGGEGKLLRAPTPREFRGWAMKSGAGSLERFLRFTVGDRYANATMACLKEEVRDGSEYFSDLYVMVIEPLSYCAV